MHRKISGAQWRSKIIGLSSRKATLSHIIFLAARVILVATSISRSFSVVMALEAILFAKFKKQFFGRVKKMGDSRLKRLFLWKVIGSGNMQTTP